MTLKEFVEQLSQQNIDFEIWIEEWQSRLDKKQWEKPLNSPVDRMLVLAFSQTIAPIIGEIINRTCLEELYESRRRSGHAMLQAAHALAQKQGIEIELKEIDIPLTMTDFMVQEGMAERKDGNTILTEKGKQAADSLAKEIAAHK